MKKVLAVGATPDEEQKLRAFCQENQWDMSVTDSLGRRKKDYPVQNVLNAFRMENNIRATARATGINPGPVHRILKNEGLLPKKD